MPTDCCCFSDQMQQRLHESIEKRLFQVQALSEIIWFEMLYRTDHRPLRWLSLCTFRFHEIEPSLLFVSSLQDDHLSIKRYGMKRSTPCKFVVLLHPTTAHLASICFKQLFQPFPQKRVNMRISE